MVNAMKKQSFVPYSKQSFWGHLLESCNHGLPVPFLVTLSPKLYTRCPFTAGRTNREQSETNIFAARQGSHFPKNGLLREKWVFTSGGGGG